MLKVLEPDPHASRLGDLLQHFRAQELSMTEVLHELQAELEHWHREANFLRPLSPSDGDRALRRCTELQAECDLLATELVHVRMAISGTGEELADHRGRALPPGPACQRRRARA
ncbi:MAG: hypothetical protein JNM25_02170 [Planctomycetes bacterium]|nr:hypothetical protein [Planctomycetota bacterium]